MKVAPAFKNIHHILALELEAIDLDAQRKYLSTQLKDLPTSCRQIFNQKIDIPYDLKMGKDIISTILRTIGLTILVVVPHRIGQS